MKRRNPIDVEPHQRYWRRRANRRVRKARRTIGLLRWSVILLANGIVAGALLLASAKMVDFLTRSPEFALEHIELRNVRHASAESIHQRLEPYVGRNILDLDLARVEAEVRRDPWVRSSAVRRVLPGTLWVTVSEREPAALAVIDDRTYLLDTTGYVIGPAGAEPANAYPLLTGVDGADDETLAAALRRGVMVLRRLQRANDRFARAVAELDLARHDRVVARMRGGAQLLLDPQRVGLNLQSYLELREAIDRRVGSAEYVDLRWRDRITVRPAAEGRDG